MSGFNTQNAFGANANNNSGFNNQGSSLGFGSSSGGFGTQQQNTGFGTQQQNTGFGTQQQNTGFGAQQQNTGFGSSTRFGTSQQGTGFGQTSSGFGTSNVGGFGSSGSGFGQSQNTGFSTTNTGFGQNKPSGFGTATSTATSGGFGNNSSGFGASTGFGSSTNTGFGQTNSGFGAKSTGFGQTGTNGFGQTGTSGFGQQAKAGFGQTGATGLGQQANTGFGQQANAGFGQQANTGFGQQANPGFGQQANTGFGQQANTGFGQQVNTGFGQSGTTGFGQQTASTFGQQNNGMFGASANTGFNATSGLFGNTANSSLGQTNFNPNPALGQPNQLGSANQSASQQLFDTKLRYLASLDPKIKLKDLPKDVQSFLLSVRREVKDVLSQAQTTCNSVKGLDSKLEELGFKSAQLHVNLCQKENRMQPMVHDLVQLYNTTPTRDYDLRPIRLALEQSEPGSSDKAHDLIVSQTKTRVENQHAALREEQMKLKQIQLAYFNLPSRFGLFELLNQHRFLVQHLHSTFIRLRRATLPQSNQAGEEAKLYSLLHQSHTTASYIHTLFHQFATQLTYRYPNDLGFQNLPLYAIALHDLKPVDLPYPYYLPPPSQSYLDLNYPHSHQNSSSQSNSYPSSKPDLVTKLQALQVSNSTNTNIPQLFQPVKLV